MAGASYVPVKVVFISTHYVETDAMNFKSVVQSLTGKDSGVAWMQDSSFVGQKRKKCGDSGGRDSTVSILSKNLSSKDFDTLLSELPPMDDLHWLWAE